MNTALGHGFFGVDSVCAEVDVMEPEPTSFRDQRDPASGHPRARPLPAGENGPITGGLALSGVYKEPQNECILTVIAPRFPRGRLGAQNG